MGCNGTQCCDGFSGSNGQTFPCPNAPSGWNQCAGTFDDHGYGTCCYTEGCNNCNTAAHYCDTESTCARDCKGTWCPGPPSLPPLEMNEHSVMAVTVPRLTAAAAVVEDLA